MQLELPGSETNGGKDICYVLYLILMGKPPTLWLCEALAGLYG